MNLSKIMPPKLKIGDTIGVVAPSSPIIGDNIEELNKAKGIVEKSGFKVKYSKNLFSNTNGYSATAKEKTEDINAMFADKEVKMIWCAKGGNNSNSTFEYLDYELIKKNPKIICGYSDITSLTNIITEKTGLITFSGTNFKTLATDETDFSYKEALNRFVDGSLKFGPENEEYITIQDGTAKGELIGGNLSLIRGMVVGKYSIDFTDKILFLEELGFETDPAATSNNLYYMKQNGVFDKIKGLWIGNYEHESGISLEKIIMDVLDGEYKFPIIKSNNFGHIERKTVIPIGIKSEIDTEEDVKIRLIENCVQRGRFFLDSIGAKGVKMFETWEELEKSIINCNKCKLCKTRQNIVFGVGNKNADIMFIGEGPGADEDRLGEPFVGRAGKLMNMAFGIVGIKREEVYIANIVKCRPPANRNPEDDEANACLNYLRNQVMLVKPKIIVLLGSVALKNILGKEYGITASRGKWVEKKGIMYMPTWHPAALLRDETKKVDFINDLNLVIENKL